MGELRHPSNLPQEILFFQILPRLPVKALPNVMCVCKKWYFFLNSGVFATTYHHHVTANDHHENHHKYIVIPATNQSPYTYTIQEQFSRFDCETPEDGLTGNFRLPFYVPFNYQNVSILTSLHGLLCVGISELECSPEYYALILWNPLTGDNKKLSTKGSRNECYDISDGIFGLYYISSDDDYRLLRVKRYPSACIYIYSLKSDTWRKVRSTEDFRQRASNWASLVGYYPEQPKHILLNEKLYFLKQVDRGEGTFIHSYSVMRFETKTEKFTEIVMPSFGNQMTSSLDFMVLKGCIHFCVAILIEDRSYMENQRCYEMIELWRMDGDGDWTKVLTYGPMSFFLWSQSLLHVMRNGNWLIQNEVDVYVLDMKKHTKEMVFTCNPIYAQHMSKEAYHRMGSKNITPRGKYIETTVSPNKYSLYARKWKFKINSLEWCTVGSWAEYEAYERVMIEKYGNDVTQNPEETIELRVQSQGGRSSDLKFATTGTPLGGVPCPPLSTKSHKNRYGSYISNRKVNKNEKICKTNLQRK
ncbi:unnamed protein product [Lactuca virosa]|uniref:F-box domain-containing protein n=1 Tax=Lactuca virosa TaxID=75947 RepID=A0AAU9LI06_9ASTR|nr:unnamed protein product [Lactuca virosa]